MVTQYGHGTVGTIVRQHLGCYTVILYKPRIGCWSIHGHSLRLDRNYNDLQYFLTISSIPSYSWCYILHSCQCPSLPWIILSLGKQSKWYESCPRCKINRSTCWPAVQHTTTVLRLPPILLTVSHDVQLLLQRTGCVVRTEHFGCQAVHQSVQVLVQGGSLKQFISVIKWRTENGSSFPQVQKKILHTWWKTEIRITFEHFTKLKRCFYMVWITITSDGAIINECWLANTYIETVKQVISLLLVFLEQLKVLEHSLLNLHLKAKSHCEQPTPTSILNHIRNVTIC